MAPRLPNVARNIGDMRRKADLAERMYAKRCVNKNVRDNALSQGEAAV